MSRPLVLIVVAAAVIVATFVIAPFFRSPNARPRGPAGLSGEAASVFALQNDGGGPVSLQQYRGRVVVMNLWASWCPPCRAEMPDLQRLADAYAGRGIAIVGVNEGESPERARAFAQSLHIRFPIWIDAAQRYGRTYGALGLPTTVIVDRRGIIVRGFDGALTYGEMKSAVTPLL